MIYPSSRIWLLGAALLMVSVGCGDSEERFPTLEGGAQLDYERSRFGVGFLHGTTQPARQSAGTSALEKVREVGDHAVLHVDIFDLRALAVGEYAQFPPASQTDYRGVSDFQSTPSQAVSSRRAEDLKVEVQGALEGVAEDFEAYTVVVDFWTDDRSNYIPWDGNSGRNIDTVGFFRADKREETIAQLEAMVELIEPKYLIIGREMERLLANEDQGRASGAEFANFVSFIAEAREAIRAASPTTRVGAGINWDRFATYVAPLYVDNEAETGVFPGNDVLDAAFDATLRPLMSRTDVIALESYTSAETDGADYYQFLRRLDDLYGLDQPIVWYSIGAPTTTSAAQASQESYLRQFRRWNRGTRPELVAWAVAFNYDGAEASGGVGGRCQKFTAPGSGFAMPLSHCFDGLFSSTLREKAAYEFLSSAVVR